MSSPTVWTHPKLGRFESDGHQWAGFIRLPAFENFRQKHQKPLTVYPLYFDAAAAPKGPSDEAVNLVLTLIDNAKLLVERIAISLYADFTGSGPNSGMWWHGDLPAVHENLEFDKVELGQPQDLLHAMALYRIDVREGIEAVPGYRTLPGSPAYLGPVIDLSFHSNIDIEHGIGVLTNGNAILGFGYAGESTPFRVSD